MNTTILLSFMQYFEITKLFSDILHNLTLLLNKFRN